MAGAAREMKEADLDASLILFSMWTEAVKNFAQEGKGNVIFLDGSVDGMQKTVKDMMALNQLNNNKSSK
jgi:prepilin-type processing-associated H-X9-DG protein